MVGWLISARLNRVLQWFFENFNKAFDRATVGYGAGVRGMVRVSAIMLIVYAVLLGLTFAAFRAIPAGFIPNQDKGYLVVNAQLPEGASLERTDQVVKRLTDIALHTKGVAHVIGVPGYSVLTSNNLSNTGGMFVILSPFEERVGNPKLSADGVIEELGKAFAPIEEANVVAFGAPTVDGLGTTSGLKMQVQDKRGYSLEVLEGAAANIVQTASNQPKLYFAFSSFSATQPQLFVDVDRVKAKQQQVSLTEVYNTLQTYLGSNYVNDITLYNRNWQVNVQADSRFRRKVEDIGALKVRNSAGQMVPLSTLVSVKDVTGPAVVNRYNLSPSADVNVTPLPTTSSGEAINIMDTIAKQELPQGMGYEWTELTYLQIEAEKSVMNKLIFPLSVLFVFMVLSALYESWSLPMAIIMIVPMCLLAAFAGVISISSDNNIFTSIGLIVLVAMAAKNAILVVAFAKQREESGVPTIDAAVEAATTRLRPIIMTSLAFILGVAPLVFAKGAGAEMRVALGVAVFAGMIGVTVFGLIFTPIFYVVVRWVVKRFEPAAKEPVTVPGH